MTGQGQNFLFDKLVLSDDATLGGDRSWGSVRSQSTLDMGGHDLTIAASAYWRFTDVEHPGDIVLRSWLDVRDNGTFPASEDVHEIRVMATGVLSFYGWPKPCPWRIRFAEPTSGTFNVHRPAMAVSCTRAWTVRCRSWTARSRCRRCRRPRVCTFAARRRSRRTAGRSRTCGSICPA